MIQTETLGAVDLQFFTPQIWKPSKGKAHKFMEHGGRHIQRKFSNNQIETLKHVIVKKNR